MYISKINIHLRRRKDIRETLEKTMQAREIIPTTANGRAFHEFHTMLGLLEKKLIKCKAGNPNLK